ncbi:hyaluronan and proteoglycan link protein 3 precursor [Anopheles sinensis]|uniref:Hyaluronan and proteoglycan link protein 3 n=1 Tax=Anopheles sinensis TaxID=74873 RepID=A0A084VEV4_ANOSI|nr:hyaluronan and proteoglycan link protein 3 precursor [Anopheles sinensis]
MVLKGWETVWRCWENGVDWTVASLWRLTLAGQLPLELLKRMCRKEVTAYGLRKAVQKLLAIRADERRFTV